MLPENIVPFPAASSSTSESSGGAPSDIPILAPATGSLLDDFEAPLLWVIPRDQLKWDARNLADRARAMGFTAWVLHEESALAISVYGPCRRRGRPIDYPAFLKRSFELKPLELFFEKCECVENAGLPDRRYWPRIWLSASEEDSPWAMAMRSQVHALGEMRARFYRAQDCSAGDEVELRSIVEPWFQTATTSGFHGDALQPQDFRFRPFAPETGTFENTSGFDLELNYPTAVSWPWIELFLRIRFGLAPRMRYSIEFLK